MTPDKARDLLDGTTPGPWHVDPHHPGDVLSPENHWLAGTYETGAGFTDAALISAAPVLAAMIAGMREEWGVSCGGEKPGAWWASREEADQCAKRMSICIHYPLPIVVVRRYVTEPEEA